MKDWNSEILYLLYLALLPYEKPDHIRWMPPLHIYCSEDIEIQITDFNSLIF